MDKIMSPLYENGEVELFGIIESEFLIEEYQRRFLINIEEILHNIPTIEIYKCLLSDYKFYVPFCIAEPDKLYSKLQEFEWYYLPLKWEHDIAVNHINEFDNVLEIGCANGDFLNLLKKEKSGNVSGIEFNKTCLDKLTEKGIPNSNQTIEEFKQHNIEKFDVVCSFQVLEHISEVRSFLDSSIACLKKNGRLIISVPNNDSFIKYDHEDVLNMPPHHMGLWNEKSLLSIASIFNLQILSIEKEYLQTYHYKWYLNTMAKRYLGEGLRRKIYDKLHLNSFSSFIIRKFAKHITGHTIIAVYQK